MAIQIRAAEFFVRNLRARLPFRYGIVTMTRVPHLGGFPMGFSPNTHPTLG